MIKIHPLVKEALSTRALVASAVLTYGIAEDRRWAKWLGGLALAGVAFGAYQHMRNAQLCQRQRSAIDVTPTGATSAAQVAAGGGVDDDGLGMADSALPDDAPPVSQNSAM